MQKEYGKHVALRMQVTVGSRDTVIQIWWLFHFNHVLLSEAYVYVVHNIGGC